MNNNVDKKVFEFVFGCALVDAVLMKAYPHPKKPKASECGDAVDCLEIFANRVLNGEFKSQDDYDNEFIEVEEQIKSLIPEFTFGNSQKLINMTFKHLYTIAYNNEVMKENFKFCHCPVDSIMLKKVWDAAKEYGVSLGEYNSSVAFQQSWSKEDFSKDEYEKSRYMAFQNAVREIAPQLGLTPLEYDFDVWSS